MAEATTAGANRGGCLVIVPTYNEAPNIAPLVGRVRQTLPAAGILVVDDASPDGTGQIAEGLAAADPRVEVLHRPAKLGLGPAYIAGYRRALEGNWEYVVQMDADFSHEPADIPRLLEAVRSCDLAVGARYVAGGGVENWGPLRRLLSRFGNAYARAVTGMRLSDATSGFQCFRRRVLAAIPLDEIRSTGYAFQIEIKFAARAAGFTIREVPIRFVDRRVGQSKMSAAIAFEACWRVWALRRRSRKQR